MDINSLPLSADINKVLLQQQIKANPEQWEAAFDFLKDNDLMELSLGCHDITVEGTYANVQEYTTKEVSQFEAHKDYIDIQVVVRGEEYIYVSDIKNAEGIAQVYDKAKDIEIYSSAKNVKAIVADPDNWVVLFPSEAHEPCMVKDGKASQIRKVVVKIPYIKSVVHEEG